MEQYLPEKTRHNLSSNNVSNNNGSNKNSNIKNDPKIKPDYEQKYKELENFCNQLMSKYENLLREKQELNKTLVDQIILNQKLQEANDKLIKPLVETLEEKNKEIQEKDEEIQEIVKMIQEKDDEIQEKNNEIQEKNNEIQEKNIEIRDINNEIQGKNKEVQEKNNEIQEKNIEIRDINNEIQGKNKKIQEKDKKIQEKDKKIQEKDKKIQEKDKKIQEKDRKIQEKGERIQEKDEELIKSLKEEIRMRDDKNQDLERINFELKKEPSKYLCTLGVATNLQLSDSDENNPVTLTNDIESLQYSLEDYITKCKSDVEINVPEVQKLLEKYGSRTVITKDHKPLIKAVLQRHVIEKIVEYADEYFKKDYLNNCENGIEANMYKKAKELVGLAMDFARSRDGIDETTKVLPIKLRQQVLAALGNRGFNDFINEKEHTTHEFIKIHQSLLNEEIGKYRKLKDLEKKREIEDMAGDIIKKVVTLFWFRILVQEPVADYIWFKSNRKIDPSCMKGKWEEDDIDNIVVDICYFPLIGSKSTSQLYTPAKIIHKIHKPQQKN